MHLSLHGAGATARTHKHKLEVNEVRCALEFGVNGVRVHYYSIQLLELKNNIIIMAKVLCSPFNSFVCRILQPCILKSIR